MKRNFMYGFMVVCCISAGFLPFVGNAATTEPALTAPAILAFTNAERIKVGLPALVRNQTLGTVAARKMADLFTRQYFAHEAPTGEDVSDLAKDAQYDYLTIGENLALGDFASSKRVVTAWMNSPGHKANILSKAYSEIGIAVGRGTYKGNMVWIAVQSFGLPRSSCPVPDSKLRSTIQKQSKELELLMTVAELREKAYKQSHMTGSALRTLIESYNKAAKLYNEHASEYRTLVSTYNIQIEKSNACIKKKTVR